MINLELKGSLARCMKCFYAPNELASLKGIRENVGTYIRDDKNPLFVDTCISAVCDRCCDSENLFGRPRRLGAV